jgi:hypothetical protein
MKSLVYMIGAFIVTLVFVNVMLFGILRINISTLSIKTLLTVQAVFAGFFAFLFFIATKKF